MRLRAALLACATVAALFSGPAASASANSTTVTGSLTTAAAKTCTVSLAGQSGTYKCGTQTSKTSFACSHSRTCTRLFIIGENRAIYHMYAIWHRADKKWIYVSDWMRVPGGPGTSDRANKAVWVTSNAKCVGGYIKSVLHKWRVNTVQNGHVWTTAHDAQPSPQFFPWYRGKPVGE